MSEQTANASLALPPCDCYYRAKVNNLYGINQTREVLFNLKLTQRGVLNGTLQYMPVTVFISLTLQ